MMASSLIIKLTDYWINNKTTSTVSVAQSFIIPGIILPVLSLSHTHTKTSSASCGIFVYYYIIFIIGQHFSTSGSAPCWAKAVVKVSSLSRDYTFCESVSVHQGALGSTKDPIMEIPSSDNKPEGSCGCPCDCLSVTVWIFYERTPGRLKVDLKEV